MSRKRATLTRTTRWATTALSAIYYATVEGRTTGGLGEGRRAVKEMELGAQARSGRRETGLVLGISEYTVSTLSFGYRWLAGIIGLRSDREDAIERLEEAASPGAETEADALLVLMVVYNREGNRAQAAEKLSRLQARFPRNRLLWLNAAATAIDAKEFEAAERLIADGLAARDLEAPPAVTGEHALWLLKRGTVRAAMGRAADAAADLMKAVTTRPRDWVRARAHVELARLAVSRQAVADASRELDLCDRIRRARRGRLGRRRRSRTAKTGAQEIERPAFVPGFRDCTFKNLNSRRPLELRRSQPAQGTRATVTRSGRSSRRRGSSSSAARTCRSRMSRRVGTRLAQCLRE